MTMPESAIRTGQQGKVRGVQIGTVQRWLGIPYGDDTGGANRFMAPRPAKPWTGVRDAFAYGAACPQAAAGPGGRMGFLLNHRYGWQSEDCLNLNIWATPDAGSRPRPVMVWIHGGSFTAGSSYEIAAYDGAALAERGDVVVVSINHRLNGLGHLDLGAAWDGAAARPELAGAVNAGILDIVAALAWVRDNIAQFGGDPASVTVFGQSGGGMKIATLLGMPAAKGLFHKAIMQSGIAAKLYSPEMTARVANLVLDDLGIAKGDLAKLQSVPMPLLAKAIDTAQTKWRGEAPKGDIDASLGFAPRLEPGSIPLEPFSPEAAKLSGQVATMAGTTLHEFNMALFNPAAQFMTREQAIDGLAAFLGKPDRMAVLYEAAARSFPEATPVELHAIVVSASMRQTALECLRARTRDGAAAAYGYRFDWETPVFDGLPGAYHCSEIPFVFDNAALASQATGGGADALRLASTMSGAWVAFARSGNPNAAGLPRWSPVTPDGSQTMVFDSQPHTTSDDADLLALLAAT
ncbi:para-nitrobenzyl esterase [Croceicoccus sp. BE223]|nr:para-nitrobenzyl esterase [Croceicoccus sp. BE223]